MCVALREKEVCWSFWKFVLVEKLQEKKLLAKDKGVVKDKVEKKVVGLGDL